MAEPRPRHRTLFVVCALGAVAMVGVAYASVPLYRAFCQATGFNGTPRRGVGGPRGAALAQQVTVRFDTNVRGLPWSFSADQTTQRIHIGAPNQAYFRVTNNGATALTGRAVYSLAPESAAEHFIKTQCFCFDDQSIPAGKTVEFPVIYYVDPKFASDPSTNALQEITLSYTFFPVKKAA